MNQLNINWQSEESSIFVNPRMPGFEKEKLDFIIKEHQLKGHILLATSGSTAINSTDIKWVALKKSAFLLAANSVNKHLNCSHTDVFLNTLPYFHVGGLALFARAHLCSAPIINMYDENKKWDPQIFVEQLTTNKVTISSMVPTQVFDCVQNNLTAPNFLKAIVVGGGALDKNLYEQAKQLKWPLLPSYGMTECCSQIATAMPNFNWSDNTPELTVLPHVKVTLSEEGKIEIASDALLTAYILQSKNKVEFINPQLNGKIITNDIGDFKNNKLLIYGRRDENIKINGENVSLNRLQALLEQTVKKNTLIEDCAIIALPHARQGYKIAAVFANIAAFTVEKNEIKKILSYFNELVFPFERIDKVYFVEKIPRTDLGKLKRTLIQLKNAKQVDLA